MLRVGRTEVGYARRASADGAAALRMPSTDRNQGLNWPEKFETCPGWGAKSFKQLQPFNSLESCSIYPSMGTFGMLFHNAA